MPSSTHQEGGDVRGRAAAGVHQPTNASYASVMLDAEFTKNFYFFRQFYKKFYFSRQISEIYKIFDFPGKNYPFTPGQIILFLFKSHHFRTYFLYMIRYNDISRPPLQPPRPPAKNMGGHDRSTPLGLRPLEVFLVVQSRLRQSKYEWMNGSMLFASWHSHPSASLVMDQLQVINKLQP